MLPWLWLSRNKRRLLMLNIEGWSQTIQRSHPGLRWGPPAMAQGQPTYKDKRVRMRGLGTKAQTLTPRKVWHRC